MYRRSVTVTRCPTLGIYKVFIQGWIFRRIHLLPANMFDLSKNPSTPDLIHAFGPPKELEEITGCFEAEATCPTCDPGTCRDGLHGRPARAMRTACAPVSSAMRMRSERVSSRNRDTRPAARASRLKRSTASGSANVSLRIILMATALPMAISRCASVSRRLDSAG